MSYKPVSFSASNQTSNLDDNLDFSLLSDYLFDDNNDDELVGNNSLDMTSKSNNLERDLINNVGNIGVNPNLQSSIDYSSNINTRGSSAGIYHSVSGVSSNNNNKKTRQNKANRNNTLYNNLNSNFRSSSSSLSSINLSNTNSCNTSNTTITSKRISKSRTTKQSAQAQQHTSSNVTNAAVSISSEDIDNDDVTLSTSTSNNNLGNYGKFDDSNMSADRRRERNRVLARKTRLRKKFFFESLQRQVAQLAKENEMLKGVIKKRVRSEIRDKILADCNTELPAIVTQTASHASSLLDKADFGLMSAIQAAQRSFCITDPSLPDNPIVFASKGFLDLTGYQLNEVIGRNCRFLQGPETDQAEVMRMRESILRGDDTSVSLTNYRADGTPFVNQIFTAALRDFNNRIVNYVGVQVEVKPQNENKNYEDDAILALPVAKKGRPRTKDRDKDAAAANKLGKNDRLRGNKNAVKNGTSVNGSNSSSSSGTIGNISNHMQLHSHMVKRRKLGEQDSTDSSGNEQSKVIAVSSSEESSLKNYSDVNDNLPTLENRNVDLVGGVYGSLDVASLFMENDDFGNTDVFDGKDYFGF